MRAAWYEKQGSAKDVLTLGEMPDPHPAAGEVRIRIAASGINPGDIKKRPSDLPSANCSDWAAHA
jgi:NADPH:quinone reductase